jgi:hypothetical protein
MIKNFLSPILLFLLFSSVTAQTDDFKYWSDGKLTWGDFKGDPGFPLLDCELKYFLTYKTEYQKINDIRVYRIVANSYADRNLSWAKPYKKTDQNLEYFQVVFDIVELHKRKLQENLDRLDGVYLAEDQLHSTLNSCEKMLAIFRAESNQGADTTVVQKWQKNIQTELNGITDHGIPVFERRNFGYGGHFGFGTGINTGTLGNFFPSTFNFIFGFDLAYRDVTLFLNATLANSKAAMFYDGEISIPEGERATVAILDFSLGYPVLNRSKFKLTPFAGVGIFEYSEKTKPGKTNVETILAPGFLFGLNTDFKLRKNLSLIPETFLNTREYTEFLVRARVYVSKANIAPDLQGYSINLTLGIGMSGNAIRLLK